MGAGMGTVHDTGHDTRNWKRVFFPVWGGQAFSLLGSQLVQFALVWYLTQTTGSATVLATASLAGLLPTVILGPIAGVLVDRWNRRAVLIASDAGIAASTVVLVALFATGTVQVWHIYALLCLRAIGQGLHNPAMLAATPLMVPQEKLTRVQGLNQAFEGALTILAAPLGAALLGILPMQSVLAIDIVTALLAILPLCFVRIPKVAVGTSGQGIGSVVSDFREGFRYIFSWTGLALLVGIGALVNVLVGPAFALLPLFVTNHLGGGAVELGWLNALFGVGMLGGGVLLGVWGGFKVRMLTTVAGLVAMSGGLVLLGITPAGSLPIAAAALLVAGLALPAINGPIMAAVQSTVEPAMQGRVISLMMSVMTAAAPLGLAVAGPFADAAGVQVLFLASGIACGAAAIGTRLVPAIMHVDEGRPEKVRARVAGKAEAMVTGC